MKDWTLVFSTKDTPLAEFKYGDMYRVNREDIMMFDVPYIVKDVIYNPKEKQIVYVLQKME